MKKKKTNLYVDNIRLLKDLTEYKEKLQEAKDNNLPLPKTSNFVGKCVWDIAENLARMPKFNRYTYIDEMKSDAIENVYMYIDNFDPVKYNNPFAYITKIEYYAFLRRIAREKKQQYVKYKIAANYGIFDAVTNTEPGAETAPFESFDNLVDYIEEFEQKKEDKKVAKKNKEKV